MRLFLVLLSFVLTVSSCSKSGDFTVTGTVKGLKKGTLYLQQVQDTTLVSLDSLVIDGKPDFEFAATLQEPQVLYLYLDKKDASEYDDRVLFFAEPGAMRIRTSLKDFERAAKVTGSKNQLKLEEFQKINEQFNDKNLDLLKDSFNAQKDGSQDAILKYDDSLKNLLVRRYRYTGNFAITNREQPIAPYLVITQIPDASVTYLDTIYKSLSPKIKDSKYGVQLKELIQSRSIQ